MELNINPFKNCTIKVIQNKKNTWIKIELLYNNKLQNDIYNFSDIIY